MRKKLFFIGFIIGAITLTGCGAKAVEETSTEATETAEAEFTSEPVTEEAEPEPETGLAEVVEPTEEPTTEEAYNARLSLEKVQEQKKKVLVLEGDKKKAPEVEVVDKDQSESTGRKTVYLDPGHGGDAACETEYDGKTYQRASAGTAVDGFPANSLGTTVGTSGDGKSECDVVYQLALKTKKALEEAGFEVTLSRDDVHTAGQGGGTAIGNWERGRRAASYDYWVVLHSDAGSGQGMHCVSYDSDMSFRNDICDAFIAEMESKRPIYTAGGYNHGYCGNSSGTLQAPSKYIENGGDINHLLYLEAGFMDNNDDLTYILSVQGQEEIAKAIAKALKENN